MMVLASGHRGVEQFWQESKPANVISVQSWDEVLARWNDADKILVGQHVTGFAQALGWMEQHLDRVLTREVVLWVEPEFTHSLLERGLPEIVVWRGEIDADRLKAWWAPVIADYGPVADRSWIVVSVYPYYPIASLVDELTAWADHHFGLGGGWVDVDWQTAQLSLGWVPNIYQKSEYPFSKLRVHKVKEHRLVVAPPPWLPGNALPESQAVKELLQQNWPWQAWFVGTQFATPWSLEILHHISAVIVWTTNTTPLTVVERSEQFLRLYRPDARIWIASDEDLRDMRKRARPNWQFLQIHSRPKEVQSDLSGKRGFKFPRIWRE